MRRWSIVIILFIIIMLCNSCTKTKVSSMMNFKAEDITSVTTRILTPDEVDTLDVRNTLGIQKFMDLLNTIEISTELEEDTPEEPWYYIYSFHLADGGNIKFIDYKNKLKVIDDKNNILWYKISTNSWEGLTELWKEYYVNAGINEKDSIQSSKDVNLGQVMKKPVIYLYPEEPTDITVQLELNGKFTYTYPEYQLGAGWEVFAYPDGTLRNRKDDKTYSYLFWEGVSNISFDMSKGFVVEGRNTTKFLEEKLAYLGLTSKEYNDFIVYWAPEMTENAYNLISFVQADYTNVAKLIVTPEPDNMLRIFMVYQPLTEYIDIPEQELTPWTREGFSVVEWGGAEISNDVD